MKIAVFSSSGNGGDSKFMSPYHFFPSRADEWDEISRLFPEHEFKVYMSLHGGSFIDEDGKKILIHSEKVPYTIIPVEYGIDEIVDLIMTDQPDIAVALTTPIIPYDWGAVRDSLVAEGLREKGVKVIAHSTQLSEEAFEKHKINARLRDLGFPVPEGVFVNKKLYNAHKEEPDIMRNAYRDFINKRIEKLAFPVIIKCDSGAGSEGLSVAKCLDEAVEILDNDESGMDMIVEEKIEGINFGAEIYGADGRYCFKGPIIFSSNANGVIDPFAGVKYGPVTGKEYKVDELKTQLLSLAEKLGFCGGVEIDLMFTGSEWYIIEINPRFSLMSMLTAAIDGRNIFINYLEPAISGISDVPAPVIKPGFDFKTAVYEEKVISDLCRDFRSIKSAMRLRLYEGGCVVVYTELTVGGFDDPKELIEELGKMKACYPDVISDKIIDSAKDVIHYLDPANSVLVW